jgi:hypothetical protein
VKVDADDDEIRQRKQRMAIIGITWGIALIATMPDPRGIVWIWAFPGGLPMFFTHEPLNFTDIGIGLVVHLILLIGTVVTKRQWLAIAWYVLICIALAMNVSGCRNFLENLDDLH